MADLTTIDGSHIFFDSAAVLAVTDHDATTGEAVTAVYGLATGTGLYRIGEPVDAFLTRIGSMQRFARFTNPDGTFVWINCKSVKVVRPALAIEHGPQAKSVIVVGALMPPVTESPDQVQQVVHAHGGSL